MGADEADVCDRVGPARGGGNEFLADVLVRAEGDAEDYEVEVLVRASGNGGRGAMPVGPPGFEVRVFAGFDLAGFVDLLPEGFGGPARDAVYAEEERVVVGLVRGGGGGLDFEVDGVDGRFCRRIGEGF